jgi:hypothetical protein
VNQSEVPVHDVLRLVSPRRPKRRRTRFEQVVEINRPHRASVEILFFADRPAATGLKMKNGLNVVGHGVVLVVRWVDNYAYPRTPVYVVGNDEPDLRDKFSLIWLMMAVGGCLEICCGKV